MHKITDGKKNNPNGEQGEAKSQKNPDEVGPDDDVSATDKYSSDSVRFFLLKISQYDQNENDFEDDGGDYGGDDDGGDGDYD